MYKRPHTKIAHFLKPWYKCRILPHEDKAGFTDFIMDSRQDTHDIDTIISQIKQKYLSGFIY